MTIDTILDTRPVLTPGKAAKRLGTSLEAATMLMESGRLRAVDLGRKGRKYLRTSVVWIEEFQAGRGQIVGSSGPGAAGSGRPSPVKGLEFAGPVKS